MKVFMTGGTGFLGPGLTRRFVAEGYPVTILTRTRGAHRPALNGVTYLEGNPLEAGAWQADLRHHEVIVNLAGASIFKRWTAKTKQAIQESRIRTTRNVVAAIAQGPSRVRVLLNASAVGYYGFHEEDALCEEDGPGDDFLATVVRDWESAARQAESLGVRVVLCRFGMVLGRRGGALGIMAPLFRMGLGSRLGSGRQWFSWIHERDLVEACHFLMIRESVSGPINCTAPHPVRNKELTRTLAAVLHRPVLLPPAPGFVVKLLLGEFGSVVLKGQKALPEKLLAQGFEFRYPVLRAALEDLLGVG